MQWRNWISSNLGIALAIVVFIVCFLIIPRGCGLLISKPAYADGYNDGMVDGYNYGAEEGARCGITWAIEQIERDYGIKVDRAYDDCYTAIREHSFQAYPLNGYDYDSQDSFRGW